MACGDSARQTVRFTLNARTKKRPRKAPPIRFYFDFVSAYSYVAMNRIDTVAARYGREVDWCVVVLADVFAHHNATSPRDQDRKSVV